MKTKQYNKVLKHFGSVEMRRTYDVEIEAGESTGTVSRNSEDAVIEKLQGTWIDYNVYGYMSVSTDNGDYWTPPSTEITDESVEVTINFMYYNDEKVELTKKQKAALEKKLEELITLE